MMSSNPIHDAMSFAAQAGNKPVEASPPPSTGSVGTSSPSTPATGPATVSASASAAATSAATGQAATGAAQASPATPPVETSTAGSQTLAGSHEVQPPSAQQAQAFNAPELELPRDPSTRDVLDGLTHAMADPSVNQTTADRLFQIHQQLMDAQKAMIQAAAQM